MIENKQTRISWNKTTILFASLGGSEESLLARADGADRPSKFAEQIQEPLCKR